MNFVDVILIIINIAIIVLGIISIPLAIKDEWGVWHIFVWVFGVVICSLVGF